MTQDDLDREVNSIINSRLAAKQAAPLTWIKTAVLDKHPGLSGADRAWYHFCASGHVEDAVRNALRKFKDTEDEPDRQMLLPGHERLQKAYLTDRNEESTLVPIDQMTSQELLAKAKVYRKLGRGCYQHADELERYAEDRRAAA